ncbi:MAG: hypothetical protein H0W13_02635 [Nitrospirales bacterium]|nr:hypothetical protein [Nitrospirales bacterium]
MTLRYALFAILTLLALPVRAEDRIQPIVHDELNFDEPFEQAASKSALRSLLNQALDLIEDHIEVKGNLQPNEAGEQQGHFQLKLYPHGKSQSDDHLSADLRFRSSLDDQHLSFDLELPKESSKNSPTSPDNAL